jgi:ubiquinone/menaquinone biosynthesis C-methylase UbiE
MSATQQIYAAPFDAVAASYDDTFSSSKIGQAQRAAVWTELARAFHPGDRTLEIGCGTGVDACFLAKRGVHVVACDSSPQMIAVTRRRIEENGLQQFVQTRVLRAEDITALDTNEMFDEAFSNFGVLNCVDDLGKFARDLAQRLKPGASVVLCWMGPCCLWEMGWYLARGDQKKAFRRLQSDGVTAKIADGAFVRVHYPSVKSLVRTFAPEFRVTAIKGIGVAVPPSYLEPWAQRHPQLFQVCERADSLLGHCPGIRLLADHILVRLQRESVAAGREP